MIDLDQLEKDIDTYHWSDVASEEVLKELVSRLRKSEADADRYRWLRNGDRTHIETDLVSNQHGSMLDRSIDDAMNKGSKP